MGVPSQNGSPVFFSLHFGVQGRCFGCGGDYEPFSVRGGGASAKAHNGPSAHVLVHLHLLVLLPKLSLTLSGNYSAIVSENCTQCLPPAGFATIFNTTLHSSVTMTSVNMVEYAAEVEAVNCSNQVVEFESFIVITLHW